MPIDNLNNLQGFTQRAAYEGCYIITSNFCTTNEIEHFRNAGTFYVDENCYGYSLRPASLLDFSMLCMGKFMAAATYEAIKNKHSIRWE